MKKLFFLLFIGLMVVTGCTKKSQYKYSGIIEGKDNTKCTCCGGYIIKINGDDKQYRTETFPSGNIDSNTAFPVTINLNYTEDDVCSDNHIITITSMIITY